MGVVDESVDLFEEPALGGLDAAVGRKLHPQMLSVHGLDAGHGRGVGTEDSARKRLEQLRSQKMRDVAGNRLFAVAHFDADHARKRRVVVFGAVPKHKVHHARNVVVDHALEDRMPGRGRLDEQASALVAAPGAPGYLEKKLEGAFVGPEVGAVQHQVGVGDHRERQAGEVESFAHHLGSDDEVDFARLHPL